MLLLQNFHKYVKIFPIKLLFSRLDVIWLDYKNCIIASIITYMTILEMKTLDVYYL
jgi:hypothetical protein